MTNWKTGTKGVWISNREPGRMIDGDFRPLATTHLLSPRGEFFWLMLFFHIQEWCGFGLQSRIEVLGKYLGLKVLANREFGLWTILQYCLASIALFIVPNFLIPRPPAFLGQQIVSQFSKCNFLAPGSLPHQNLAIQSILLVIVSGTLKQQKVYKGMSWRIEEMRVVLPACETKLAFQPWSLAWILSSKTWKSATLLLLSLNFIPKYLLGCCTRLIWSDWTKATFSTSAMLGEQKRSDLERFMHCPERLQFQETIFWMFGTMYLSFWKNKRESSANRRCVKVWPCLPSLTWFPYFFQLSSVQWKGHLHKVGKGKEIRDHLA